MTRKPRLPKEKSYISPSQIELYLQCGEKYRRRYIEKEKSKPAMALHVGSAVHKAAQIANLHKRNYHEDMDCMAVMGHAQNALVEKIDSEGFSEEETVESRDMAIEEASGEVARLSQLLAEHVLPKYQPLFIEEKVRIPLPDSSRDLLGVVDLIDTEGNVVDYKTAGRKKDQSEAEHSFQLTTYAAAHVQLTGKAPSSVRLEVLIDKKVPEVQTLESVRTRDDLVSFERTIRSVVGGIEQGTFLPAKVGRDWWCSPTFCEFWDTCPYVSKRLVQIHF